jgi:hypothetical protein
LDGEMDDSLSFGFSINNLIYFQLKRLENTESNGGIIGLENELNAIR